MAYNDAFSNLDIILKSAAISIFYNRGSLSLSKIKKYSLKKSDQTKEPHEISQLKQISYRRGRVKTLTKWYN